VSIGIGDALREAREEQGRTQADAAAALRVRTDYIEALEEEAFEVFGADTYARGHLRNYARYLGIDPQPLVDRYDREISHEDPVAHFADAPIAVRQREPLPRWVTGVGIAIAVLVAALVIGMLGGDRTPEQAERPEVPTSPTPTEPTQPPTSEPSPTPSPTPTFEGVNLLLAVEADCWVDISVDGQRHPRANSILRSGETLEVVGEGEVRITYGNAGGVVVQHNGAILGAPGGNGQVVTVTYGPEGPIES
jgi:transcriptional regulator with XRE-family HTH domain